MLRKELQNIESTQNVRKYTMLEDVENFLNGNEKYKTIKQVIGVDRIFCGHVVKDWFGVDKYHIKHKDLNEKMVQLYLQHYWKYQNERN